METLLWLLWWVIVAYVASDWMIQPRWIAESKGKFRLVMLVHCIWWTGAIAAVLAIFGEVHFWEIGFLLIGHFMIDQWKAKKWDNKATCKEMPIEKFMKYVYIDQALHLIQLIVVVIL